MQCLLLAVTVGDSCLLCYNVGEVICVKIETIMNKIQQADWNLTMLKPESSYNFAIDINAALKKLGHYSLMFYSRCENDGLSYEQATDMLGKHLRDGLGIKLVPKSETNHEA